MNVKTIALSFLLGWSFCGAANAQEIDEHPSKLVNPKDLAQESVITEPKYPGGLEKFASNIIKKLSIPEDTPQGEYWVYIKFTVNTDGSLTNIGTLRPVGNGLDEAIVTAIGKIGQVWAPATKDAVPITYNTSFPITLRTR